ncbi:GtrA family protein [Vagococcus vulneris]|uniref:GtrA/DPMS transmembrane domain-containing protein n=1 Tax=Vagococcus vulneris TaxID=1977869 RepID=A0A429ZXB4_9ENTE|nr:GtrA family protein [Vagococcus vulneris]RST98319.1 hypothetical protein CBF37_08395 [Vagococcus vulneris]
MKKIVNRETITYIIFGALTTAVYFVTRFSVVAATENSMFGVVCAQVAAILFAFITNKIFVFQDRNWKIKAVIFQLFGFIVGRLFVFGLDLGITYITVDKFPDFFIHLLFFDKFDYQSFFFSNPLMNKFIGSPSLLNEFIFALLVQVLAIIINYIISKKAVFKEKN